MLKTSQWTFTRDLFYWQVHLWYLLNLMEGTTSTIPLRLYLEGARFKLQMENVARCGRILILADASENMHGDTCIFQILILISYPKQALNTKLQTAYCNSRPTGRPQPIWMMHEALGATEPGLLTVSAIVPSSTPPLDPMPATFLTDQADIPLCHISPSTAGTTGSNYA